MVVELRDTTDGDGTRWQERVRDGVLESRERLPMRFQPPKVRLEMVMVERYEDWRRWKTTREEAQARGVAAPIVTALTNRENAAWAAYAAAINEWRLA